MNKEYQFYVLKKLFDIYPRRTDDTIYNDFIQKADGDNLKEKEEKVARNLMVLNDMGYLDNFFPRISVDGFISNNRNFSITAKGLQLLEAEILSSDDKNKLIQKLLNQSHNTRAVFDKNIEELKTFLQVLPIEVLKTLVNKGVETVFHLLS